MRGEGEMGTVCGSKLYVAGSHYFFSYHRGKDSLLMKSQRKVRVAIAIAVSLDNVSSNLQIIILHFTT